jgi:hypothetical protein
VQKGMQNAQKWCDSNDKQIIKSYGKKGQCKNLFYHITSTSSISLLQLMDSMCDGSQL